MTHETEEKPEEPLTLTSITERRIPPLPWAEGDNIPWNDPSFSHRMLAEHLSQRHDLASRRSRFIDAHVVFIHQALGARRGARILDLACGPGLYLHRLSRLGHEGVGIDFAPAAIAHAREVSAREQLACSFRCEDLREAPFGADHDACLLLFGQVNVFTRAHAQAILKKAYDCLAPGGMLFVEPQHPSIVRDGGETTADWTAEGAGLFCSEPHLLLHERFWDEDSRTATDRWHVVRAADAAVRRYAMSTCSYTPEELQAQLSSLGFRDVAVHPSLSGRVDPEAPAVFALVAIK